MTPALKFLFLVTFIFIYFMAVILVRPLNYHAKRKYSTAYLKFTYLAYLAIFLIFTYLFIFNSNKSPFNMENPNDSRGIMYFTLILLSFFVPNITILARRRVKRRVEYNIWVGSLNILFSIFLWFLIDKTLA